jgi:hypothetical protein
LVIAHNSDPMAVPYRSASSDPDLSASRGLRPADRHTNSSRTKKTLTCSTRGSRALVASTSVASAITTQIDPRSAGVTAKDGRDLAGGSTSPKVTDCRSVRTVTGPTSPRSSRRSTRSTGIPRERQRDSMWPVRPPSAQITADEATMAS